MSLATPQGGFLTLLRKRNFLLLWLAQLVSMTIQNASNYAVLVLINEGGPGEKDRAFRAAWWRLSA